MAARSTSVSIAESSGASPRSLPNNGLERTPQNTASTGFRQWAQEVLKPAYEAQQARSGRRMPDRDKLLGGT
jgi:hypothetical protein